jgi:hypothetical protein
VLDSGLQHIVSVSLNFANTQTHLLIASTPARRVAADTAADYRS